MIKEDLLEFLQKNLQFQNPCGPSKTGLYPHQIEWVEQYQTEKNMFWGLSRQIGATSIMAGICAWEMLRHDRRCVVTDNAKILLQVSKIFADLKADTFLRGGGIVLRENNSSIVRLVPPCKGYAADLLIISPDAIEWQERIIDTYRCMRPMAYMANSKTIVASLPGTFAMKEFFHDWKQNSLPYLLNDCFKTGMVERYGQDWFEYMQALMTPEEFDREFLCDFTKP